VTDRVPPGYHVGAAMMRLVTALLANCRVEGRQNVPQTGPLIVAANHFSLVDPPLLGATFPRPLRFFAKAELWNALPSRLFCDAIGVLPLRRGEADRAALRQALGILKDGGAIAFFPEGTRGRSYPRTLKPARPGIAFLARLSGAPVLPVAIAGTDVVDSPADILTQAFTRPRFDVCIGRPVQLPRDLPLEEATTAVMQEIAHLLPERYRGPYAPADIVVP
jgi:1-acyl-sn-glycerol-3-phosphate acyltransferase